MSIGACCSAPVVGWAIGICMPPCSVGIVIGFELSTRFVFVARSDARPLLARILVFAVALAGAFLCTADFFFSACLAASGIVMPGMFICAAAGAETVASTTVAAVAVSMDFTIPTPIEGRREAPPLR